jgi:NADPH:quinone reductase
MKAVVITEPGGPEVLQLRDVPDPIAGAGQILVRVHATAINRADLLQRRGQYAAPPGVPADIPGLEYAGIVEDLGEATTRWQPGDRVMGIIGGGAYAEYVTVHEAEALPVPEKLSLEEAGAVPEAFITADDALFTLMQLHSGQAVLILAAASGVGTAAVQLARWIGATVIATSRTASKLEAITRLGAQVTVDTNKQDYIEECTLVTEGRGVDGVLDLVGGSYFARNLEALARRGRLILVGLTAGATSEANLGLILRKRLTVIGTVMRARPLEEKIITTSEFAKRTLPLLEAGTVKPIIDRVLPMWEVARGHEVMEKNQNVGKIVLTWARTD